MTKETTESLVSELISLLKKGNAHVSFDNAVKGVPADKRTTIPEGLPYSIWQLVEHIRIAQHDILDFSISSDYEELDWPAEYWVENPERIDDEAWEKSLTDIEKNNDHFFSLLKDRKDDLFTPFSWGKGQHLLREALLIADHNSYHTAEIVVIRRLLKCWK